VSRVRCSDTKDVALSSRNQHRRRKGVEARTYSSETSDKRRFYNRKIFDTCDGDPYDPPAFATVMPTKVVGDQFLITPDRKLRTWKLVRKRVGHVAGFASGDGRHGASFPEGGASAVARNVFR